MPSLQEIVLGDPATLLEKDRQERIQARQRLVRRLGEAAVKERVAIGVERVRRAAMDASLSTPRAFIFYEGCAYRDAPIFDDVRDALGISEENLRLERRAMYREEAAGAAFSAPSSLIDYPDMEVV